MAGICGGVKLALRHVFAHGLLMSIDQIAAEALRLSPSQRALLAQSLWESLSDPFEAAEPDGLATVQLAAERDRQIEAGEVQAISHDIDVETPPMKVEYHPAVQDELREIRDYYEKRSPGLGALLSWTISRGKCFASPQSRRDGWSCQGTFGGAL